MYRLPSRLLAHGRQLVDGRGVRSATDFANVCRRRAHREGQGRAFDFRPIMTYGGRSPARRYSYYGWHIRRRSCCWRCSRSRYLGALLSIERRRGLLWSAADHQAKAGVAATPAQPAPSSRAAWQHLSRRRWRGALMLDAGRC
jgi:hypothetical protein